MSDGPQTLYVEFGAREALKQESHASSGGLFLPVPEPAPEPLRALQLELRTGAVVVAIEAMVVQVIPGTGLALTFEDPEAEKRDAEELAHYLMNFGKSFVWFGGITTCVDGYNRNLDRQQVALTYLDKMVCLGEALGLLRLENPENGPWGNNLLLDLDELIEQIEDALQISVAPPLGRVFRRATGPTGPIHHWLTTTGDGP